MPLKNAYDSYTHFSNLQAGNANGGGGGLKLGINTDVVAGTTAYTVLAKNSGKIHMMPDVSANCTYTLPAAEYGVKLIFQYAGVAADGEDHIFTAAAGDFMIGGTTTVDTGAGTSSDQYANGSSHVTLTMDIPQAGTYIHFTSDGTLWYVGGIVCSDTPVAFS